MLELGLHKSYVVIVVVVVAIAIVVIIILQHISYAVAAYFVFKFRCHGNQGRTSKQNKHQQ